MIDRRIPFATLAFAVVLSSSVAGAQGTDLAYHSSSRPTITRASDVVHSPTGKVAFGTQLVFKRRDGEMAARIRRAGFQIRVFSLRDGESLPMHEAQIDGCNLYLTGLHSIVGTDSVDIEFDNLDERWLVLSSSGNSVRNGRYLLVFERLGATDKLFRLNASDVQAYFSAGIVLEIDGQGRAALDRVRAAYHARMENTAELVKEIDRRGDTVPCYRYQHYASGDTRVASCAPQPDPNS